MEAPILNFARTNYLEMSHELDKKFARLSHEFQKMVREASENMNVDDEKLTALSIALDDLVKEAKEKSLGNDEPAKEPRNYSS